MRDSAIKPITEIVSIAAPIERCFALSTRVELVKETLGMNLVGGVTTGHIAAGSHVVWKGWKFGLPTEHHTLITGFEAPRVVELPSGMAKAAFFQDSQEKGRFAEFHHDHFFREYLVEGAPQTLLRDEIYYKLPFGFVGGIVGKLVMEPHVRMLARTRFAMIKQLAEGEGWREWVQ